MRTILLALALIVGACTVPGSQVEDLPGLAGTYVANGIDPLGVEYSGTVIISEGADPGEYAITWLITGAVQEGFGRLAGDRFTVEWTTRHGGRGDSSGTATYEVGPGGALIGERTVDGLAGFGTEEIYPRG